MEKKKYKIFIKETESKCLICMHSRETEHRYLSSLSKYINDNELKNKYLLSEGLCISHYKMLLKMNKNTVPEWISEFQIKKLKEMLIQLDHYLESCNFTSKTQQSDLSKEESLIWRKVIRVLFGYEGLIK